MGIGLIALAFIFMYGLKLTINDVNLIPAYISALLMILGLLCLSLIHISEPTRQAEISYAVFCLKKKNKHKN